MLTFKLGFQKKPVASESKIKAFPELSISYVRLLGERHRTIGIWILDINNSFVLGEKMVY